MIARSRLPLALVVIPTIVLGGWMMTAPARADDAPKAGPALAHSVFFTLKEDTQANREKLVAGCKKYLTAHEGLVSFSVGTLNPDLNREVNDTDFDVALLMVFRSRADQDRYQVSPRHESFIAECSGLWASVRVFDADVSIAP
jgi:hypothetical protein